MTPVRESKEEHSRQWNSPGHGSEIALGNLKQEGSRELLLSERKVRLSLSSG